MHRATRKWSFLVLLCSKRPQNLTTGLALNWFPRSNNLPKKPKSKLPNIGQSCKHNSSKLKNQLFNQFLKNVRVVLCFSLPRRVDELDFSLFLPGLEFGSTVYQRIHDHILASVHGSQLEAIFAEYGLTCCHASSVVFAVMILPFVVLSFVFASSLRRFVSDLPAESNCYLFGLKYLV
jgi:hypothetical protein